MDEDEEIKKSNIVEKNYENMDISELKNELIVTKKNLKIIEEAIKIRKKIKIRLKNYLKNNTS